MWGACGDGRAGVFDGVQHCANLCLYRNPSKLMNAVNKSSKGERATPQARSREGQAKRHAVDE